MEITYVAHSSFIVSFEDCNLLFDYYKGDLTSLEAKKPLYIFSSHAHWDHFNVDIVKKIKGIKEVTFILSSDIKEMKIEGEEITQYLQRNGMNCVYWLGEDEKLYLKNKDKQLCITTLKSTDEGVAFVIEYDSHTIFHSGDLHWWSWIGETNEYNKKMEEDFKGEIRKLIGTSIDVAFLVLDPRLESRYDWGMKYCIEQLSMKYVVPMHCQEKYSIIQQYKEDNKEDCKKIMLLDFTTMGESKSVGND